MLVLEKLVESLVRKELANILFEQSEEKINEGAPYPTIYSNPLSGIPRVDTNLQIRQSTTRFSEGKLQSISPGEMRKVIERLPKILRNHFPNIGSLVVRARQEILPFDLKKIWAKHPEIFEELDSFIFGLHLGDPWKDTKSIPTNEEQIKIVNFINAYMKKRGWFVQSWDEGGETLRIQIVPERTKQLDDIPHKIFHLTDTENIPSIRSSGLKPKDSKKSDRSYTPRVYVFTDKNLLQQQIEQNIEAHQDSFAWFPKLTKTLDMSVVEIDSNKLRKGTKFYKDPEFGGEDGAYYTYTHIPPEAIVGIQRV